MPNQMANLVPRCTEILALKVNRNRVTRVNSQRTAAKHIAFVADSLTEAKTLRG